MLLSNRMNKFILKWFTVTRLLILVLIILPIILFPNAQEPLARFKDTFRIWDAFWYINIAEGGYSSMAITTTHHIGSYNYAYFPLYPLLIRILNLLIHNSIVSGLVISNFCLLTSAKLITKIYKPELAKDVVRVLFLFPTTFLLSGLYTESLFLTILLAVYYYYKKGNWPLVVLFSFLLGFTRPFGILIIIPLTYSLIKKKEYISINQKLRLISLSILVLPYLIFNLYLYKLTGIVSAHSYATSDWGRSVTIPYLSVFTHLREFTFGQSFSVIFSLCIGSLIWTKRKLLNNFEISLALSMFIFPLLFSSLPAHYPGIPRYVLVIFPLYLILAKLHKTKREQLLINLLLLTILIILTPLWTFHGDFVI